MKHSLKIRVLSLILACVMISGYVPINSLATESEQTEPSTVATEPNGEATGPSSETTEPETTEGNDTVEPYLETAEGYVLDETATEPLSGEIGATANGLPDDMAMVSDKVSTLAPGIVERQITAYDKNGDRVLMYVATADPTVETMKVYANYMDNQNKTWGMQKTTEQAAAFESNHEGERVIVAINGSYFNTSNGAPTGAFVMEGVDASSSGDSYSFFALLKDGTYMIGAKGEYSSYKGQIQEAIGGYIHLVKDGVICSGLNTVEKYPRQTIGLTAEGKIIVMTADCLAAVGSAGLTVQEQAEVMLSLGCVEAIHLDGGGSGTYCSRPAGAGKLQVTNNPSNGTERAVSNTLILVSTAKADGELDSAQLTAAHDYVTPGSKVEITAVGLDASKGPAEIPEDVVWQLADSTMGTVEDGVFTSNGTVGTATVELVYKNDVVGSVNIEVVNPDKIDFGGTQNVIIPYGTTVELPVTAYYGINKIFYKAEDFTVVVEPVNAVTVEGLSITAPNADSNITEASATVSLTADATVSATVALVFGKGSEVVFDFEKDTAGTNMDNWILRTHESTSKNYGEKGEVYIVDKNSGMVHDGEQALAFNVDMSQPTGSGSNTAGYSGMSLSWNGEAVDVKGAKSIGFWLYIPEDAMTTEITLNTVYYDANGVAQRRTIDCYDDNGEYIYTPYWGTKMEGSGWHYVKADFSEYSDDLLIKDEPALSSAYKRNFFIKIFAVSGGDSVNFPAAKGDFTYYIDNITVDYSDAVEDRELPVFSAAYVNAGALDTIELTHGNTATVASGKMSFAANVADNTTNKENTLVQNNKNTSGINASTAKVYVDGNAVAATCSNGIISSAEVTLPDGYHTVRFEIADNNGNVGYITRTINVNAGSDLPTVELVPHDASLNRLLSGSVYWVDLVSDDIANIKSINTVLNLDSTNHWELEHMVVAPGFEVTYSASGAQTAENDVCLTIERNADAVDAGSNVIVSIPIRVWESLLHENPKHTEKTPQYQWNSTKIDTRGLCVKVDQGVVKFAGNTEVYFSDRIDVEHEAYTYYYAMDKAYYEAKKASGGYHTHTAVALEDLVSTCTESGYTGRTFCEVCDSVVVWGTTVAANGHTYDFADGVLKCACGELFNGVHTDGKEYVDGLAKADGWAGNSYYKDGAKLTGVHKVSAPDASGEFYYDFGEDGVCEGQMKFSGLFYDETVSAYRYAKIGVLDSGWIQIDGKWHYFDPTTMNAVTGDYYYESRGVTYHFDETGMTEGAWQKTKEGTRFWYGKWYYQATGNRVCFAEIDGKTYNFDKDGYLTTGIHALYWDWTHDMRGEMDVWEFDENGVLVGQITDKGLIDNKRGGMYLIEEDGFVHGGNAHVASYNGDLYFVVHSGKLKQNATQEITDVNSNGLLAAGTYYFGEDCKLFTGIKAESDGYLYYYENGQIAKGAYNSELAEINGTIYLIKWSGKVAMNETRDVTAAKTNGLLPAGTYYFDANGRAILPTGIIKGNDDLLYYYKDGKLQTEAYNSELVEIDGNIYLIKWSGKVAANETRVIPADKTNGLLAAGTYYFGADGKLFTGIKEESDGLLYYYKDGKLGNCTYNSELVESNGEIYLVKWSGKVAFNETRKIPADKTNGLLAAGTYYFGADGKLFTGVMEGDDGILYYYQNGQLGNGKYNSELVKVDGDIYLVKWSGKVAANETRAVTAAKANGLVEAGTYTFGADGKLQK